MKHRIHTALAVLLTGVALAAPNLVSERPTLAPEPGTLHPGVQAGRLKLASKPGTYVDLGAPLAPHEAQELAPYRAVRRDVAGRIEPRRRAIEVLLEPLQVRLREPARGSRTGG